MKNRGMLLEQIINKTIKKYDKDNMAIFHKKEIPIKFANVLKNNKTIKVKGAYIVSKSTTDYYGLYDGIFIAFEAKSTKEKIVPKSNFKIHQQKYLEKVEKHGGIGFYILYFSSYNEFYLVRQNKININNGYKINEARRDGHLLEIVYPGFLNILEGIENLK